MSPHPAWAATTIAVRDKPHRVVGVAPDVFAWVPAVPADAVVAVVRMEAEITWVVADDAWQSVAGVCEGADVSPLMAVLNLTVAADIGDTGYLAAGVAALAEAEISVVVHCGYADAVISVPWDRRDDAVATLENLIARAKSLAAPALI